MSAPTKLRCWCGKPVVLHSGEWWHQLGVGDEVRLWVGQGPDPEPDHEPRPVAAFEKEA